jgi:tetratricopeptide (TPR) repeat protein
MLPKLPVRPVAGLSHVLSILPKPLMRLLSMTALMLLTGMAAHAQNDYWADSLKKALSQAPDDRHRVETMLYLSAYYNQVDNVASDRYAEQAIRLAELSRDRKLMVSAYITNGNRFMNASLSNKSERGLESFRQAERIARENGMEDELVKCYCALATGFRNFGNNEQALQYSNLAVVMVAGKGDSVSVPAYISLGQTYEARNQKLLAFRNYLEASDIAEQSGNNALMRDADVYLANFYMGLSEYDKAIDYQMKAVRIDEKITGVINLLNDYNLLGAMWEKEQKYDLALEMFEKSIALADRMHYDLFKVNSYVLIFTMYFNANQISKGVDYLNGHPVVMDIVNRAGLQFFIDQAYGNAYSEQGRFDSAGFYFRRAEPMVEAKVGIIAKSDFYAQVGNFYKRKGDNADAIRYYMKMREIGQATKNLGILRASDSSLDILYARTGDYKSAHLYNVEFGIYSDSIQSLARSTDLLKLEVDNDNRRRERQAREEELSREHRHNVQYMGFTIGLVLLFLLLAMMGWFVVSPRTIRALGFFSFIFLFEYIILLADKQIQEWTHEEPWKILMIKIGLAAILLPLHHWLEHKVIHYLTTHRTNPKEKGALAGKNTPK